MNPRWYGVLGLLLAVILFVGFNLFARDAFRSARVDVTENRLYTLSEGSRRVVGNLEEPLTLSFYFSQGVSESASYLRAYAERVRDLLDEYEAASHGQVRLEVIDPEPFSEAEEKAVSYGLESVQLPGGTDRMFFGLVGLNTTTGVESVPFFDPQREASLEYDLTKLLYKLAHPEKKVVGMMSSLPLEGARPMGFGAPPQDQRPWFLVRQLREFFDLRTVEPTATAVPAEVDVLILVHPKNLGEATLYALDQFVLRGGRLIAFVDPHCEADDSGADPSNPFAGMNAPKNSDLGRLFTAWGVRLVPAKVVGDRQTALVVNASSQRGGQERVPFVPYLQLGKDYMNTGDVVTGELQDLKMGLAGALEQLPEAGGFEFVPLIQTSAEAMLIDASKLSFFPQAQDLLKDYQPERAYTLAARVRGRFATAFPEGKPAAAPETAEADGETPEEDPAAAASGEHLNAAADVCTVLLVADADMLSDRFWVQVVDFFGTPMAQYVSQNFDFLVYAIENLSGSNDLLGIPSRKEFERPFERVEALAKAAQEKFQVRAGQFQEQLRETQNKLRQLSFEETGSGDLVLSPAQRDEIKKLQEEELRLQRELRNINLELNKDIDRLGTRVKLMNIGLMPVLVLAAAIGIGVLRARKRARS